MGRLRGGSPDQVRGSTAGGVPQGGTRGVQGRRARRLPHRAGVQEAQAEEVLARAQGEVRQAAEEGGLPQLQRPLLPASSEQGVCQGDCEAAEGGLHPRGHQDEDQGGRVVVKWIFHISITFACYILTCSI